MRFWILIGFCAIAIVLTARRGLAPSAKIKHAFEDNDFGVLVEDNGVASIVAKKAKVRVGIDVNSWSGGIAIDYFVEPAEGRKMSWQTDLNSDGIFDIRGEHNLRDMTTSLSVRLGAEWVAIKSLDKAKRTAYTPAGEAIRWSVEQGWFR